MSRVDMFEVEELARDVLELDDSYDYEDIEDALFKKLGVDFEQFHSVASALIDYVPTIQCGITNRVYKGFVKHGKSGLMRAIIKVEVDNEQGND